MDVLKKKISMTYHKVPYQLQKSYKFFWVNYL